MEGICGIVHKDSDRKLIHVPLEKSLISVSIVDVSARVTITQVYRNDSNEPTPRSKYVFPVPARAAVCAFSMLREDRNLIYGVAKEKSRAVEEYEAGMREGKFSGLVNWVSDDVFTISLGSIPAKQTVTTRIMFVMDLMNEDLSDKVRLQLPLSFAERYGPTPTEMVDAAIPGSSEKVKVKITVEVQSTGALLSVISPTHDIQLKRYNTHYGRPSRRRMIAKYRSESFLDRDFILVIRADGLDTPRCFAETDPRGGTVALQLMLVPKFDLPPIPKQEYIFLVDRSGSMNHDQKIDVAKESLAMLIRCLPGNDTLFNVFSFGTGCSSLWPQSAPYNEQNLQHAAVHINTMDAEMGGTEIRGALETIFNSRNRLSPTAVFVLTDGEVQEEAPSRDVISAAVSRSLQDAPLRLFILGIGLTTSTAVCENLARTGNGECLMANSSETILEKCTSLLRAGRTSTIEDISIDWGVVPSRNSGMQLTGADTVHQSPLIVHQLYPHSRVLIFAILDERKAPKKVKISGKVEGGKMVELEVKVESVKFGKDRSSPPFIHTLAARRLIRDLEDEKYKGKLPEEAWKEAIVRIGERYQLASSHTSFVAVDYGKAPPPRLRKPSHDPNSTPSAVLRTVWTYISNPFSLYGSGSGSAPGPENLMTQPNLSVPGGWPGGSESSVDELELNGNFDYESSYGSTDTLSTLSSLESRSTVESERRGRRSRAQARSRQRQEGARSPSPQVYTNHGTASNRNSQRKSTAPPGTPAQRISPDVGKLVQLMSHEGSFAWNDSLAQIVGQSAFDRGRGLHTDESLCATALAIAFLEKNLADHRELLAALVDKGMEFVKAHSAGQDFRRVLMRAKELVQ